MSENFHIEEFKALRAEIDSRIKEGQTWESLGLTATAAVYAWLATNSFCDFAWWIPVLFPAFGLLRHSALMVRILQIAGYIRDVEAKLSDDPLTGWETHLLNQRVQHPYRSRLISFSSFVFWTALLILTIYIAAVNAPLK